MESLADSLLPGFHTLTTNQSIKANSRLAVESEPGKPFVVRETGWGEFEITIRLFYHPDSGEKPQTIYHYLKLHPYGDTEEERDAMQHEVRSWQYEEQLFNEPYEAFYRTLTSGAHPKNWPGSSPAATSSRKSGGKGKGPAIPPLPDPTASTDVWQRTAMIPAHQKPRQPFSLDAEAAEIKRINEALETIHKLQEQETERFHVAEQDLLRLRAENHTTDPPSTTLVTVASAVDQDSVAGRIGRRGSKLGGG